MTIYSYTLGDLSTNCYIVANKGECLVIDPADSPEFLAEKITRKNLKPIAIIATHGHFDHILGASGLKAILKIPFYAHKKDDFLIKDIEKSASHWLNRKIVVSPLVVDKFLEGGDKIKLGDEILEVIHAPGHTPGSICLYNRKNKTIFTGDLLFNAGIGRTDFSYSNPKQFEASLKKILKLPKDVRVYSGHGEETMIGDEQGQDRIL